MVYYCFNHIIYFSRSIHWFLKIREPQSVVKILTSCPATGRASSTSRSPRSNHQLLPSEDDSLMHLTLKNSSGWTLVETELSAVMGWSKLGCECSLAHKWVTSNSNDNIEIPQKERRLSQLSPKNNPGRHFPTNGSPGIPGTAAGNSSCCPAVLPSGNSKSSWTSCSWVEPSLSPVDQPETARNPGRYCSQVPTEIHKSRQEKSMESGILWALHPQGPISSRTFIGATGSAGVICGWGRLRGFW